MRRARHQLLTLSIVAALFGACGGEPSEGDESSIWTDGLTSSDGRISAVIALESDWGSGYRAKVTLTSTSSSPTTGWTVGVNMNGGQMTSADLSSVSPSLPASGLVTITNASWNASVSSTKSVSFGFNGSGTGRPTIASVSYTGGGANGGTGGSSNGTGGSSGTAGRGGTGGSGGTGGTGGTGAGGTTSSNPFAGVSLFVDGNSQACRSTSAAGRAICATPQAEWIGNWSGNVADSVRNSIARAGSQLKVLVAYNIYRRDCGGQSSGGASSPQAYRDWISSFASGIGNSRAVIILEPDALAHNCNGTATDSTAALLKYAVETLEARPNAAVYIDAGHSRWIGATEMATRLRNAGIATATGFALNVSNFQTTESNVSYGKQVAGLVGNKPFVIDTSRNGLGSPDTAWCNPRPRGLGKKATSATGDAAVHAYLWVKRPGESDGACNGGPAAGQWFEDYAQHLFSNARF